MKLKTLILGGAVAALSVGTALAGDQPEDPAVAFLNNLNAQITSGGYEIEISKMETFTDLESNSMGQTILASDHGNKQLGSDWVAGDPRRDGRNNITWAYDGVDLTADVSAADQRAAIVAGQTDWDEETCSNIGIDEVANPVGDLGFIQFLVTGGAQGFPPLQGIDIVQAGFLPAGFFDAIAGCAPGDGCGANILGVTFSLNFVGDTDIDNNKRGDKGLAEIYYNDRFLWRTDGGGLDLQTVALHEAGHSLSRAHFGNVAVQKGRLKTSPDAVMNAIYAGPRRELLGPDKGGHCSDWSAWPNK